ncbi:hypothetical protein [Cellulosilyticum sp. WCF-2]|uniref:hypothetical protein n=1 Tax=Cellulosilyticum sp. WCF-2 TaxID=2497860 RepID=UPI000F8F7E45|nr:hypothetical protein [Cellulosilyticum sp. WCF-2]QEH70031.1 hypothetical protein EKH84_17190 [Cellulosilyticum sp. WCF-2]
MLSNLQYIIEDNINSAFSKEKIKNFQIYDGVYLEDDIWDFSEFNTSNRERHTYRFNFDKLSNMLKFGTKIMVLDRRFRQNKDFSTVQKDLEAIRAIDNYCIGLKINDIRLLNQEVLREYFEERLKGVTNRTRNRRAITLIRVLEVYKKNNLCEVDYLITYLEKFISENPEIRSLSSKNSYIPDALCNQICAFAVNDLNNSELAIRHRIAAGLLIILIETGMRVEEVTLLETNRIKVKGEGEKSIHYLEFYTYKITEYGEDRKLTYTFLTKLALHAYQMLCMFSKNIINGISETSYLRNMIQLKENKIIPGRIKDSDLRSGVSKYTKKECDQLEKDMYKFIFVSDHTGMQKRGGSVLKNDLQQFFVRHDEEFDLKCLSEDEKQKLRSFKLTSEVKYKKFFLTEERKEHPFESIKDKQYLWINPHAFRVHLCTKLFMKKIHIDFIRKHLNHLTEEMTVYYNKEFENNKSLDDVVNILIEDITEEGTIQSDPNQAKNIILKEQLKSSEFQQHIKQINGFIEKGNLNINRDMKKVFKMLLKTNSPVVENELGICVISIVQKVCEQREYFSSQQDNYNIGVTLNSYKNLDLSYQRFKQKLELIKHNKLVAEQRPQYQNEYEREVNALRYYVKNRLIKELNLLTNDIATKGAEEIIRQYPRVKNIVINHKELIEEVSTWIK